MSDRPNDSERDEAPEVDAAPRAEEAAEVASESSAPDRLAELEDRVRRQQADFVNETKRIQRQADERGRYAVEGLVGDLLPVFDALHSARDDFAARVSADEQNDTAAAALEGFDLVEKELLNVLGRHGVTRIETAGQSFDPGLHHAIMMMDAPDLSAGAVARELRPGFLLNDRVVRPAHVAVVASRGETGAEGGDDADQEDADQEG